MSPSFTDLQSDPGQPQRVMTGDTTGSGRSAAAQSWRRALELTAPIVQNPTVTFPVVIERLAGQFRDAPALISDQQTLSYAELGERVEHYARWALNQRLTPGDVVCLIMPNCPEYLAIWLGVTRVGGVVALINTNLVGDALRHVIDIVRPCHVIAAAEFLDAVTAVAPRPAPGGRGTGARSI
jgi:fatty-acyl-CoA synthase